jgi:hypothetical protein
LEPIQRYQFNYREKRSTLIQAALDSGRSALAESVRTTMLTNVPAESAGYIKQPFLSYPGVPPFCPSYEYVSKRKETNSDNQMSGDVPESRYWSPQSIVKICFDDNYHISDRRAIFPNKTTRDSKELFVVFEETIPYDYFKLLDNEFAKSLLMEDLASFPRYVLGKYSQLIFSQEWLQYAIDNRCKDSLTEMLKFACADDMLYEQLTARQVVIPKPFCTVGSLPAHYIERGLVLAGFNLGDMEVTSVSNSVVSKHSYVTLALLESESSNEIYESLLTDGIRVNGLVTALILQLIGYYELDKEYEEHNHSSTAPYAGLFALWNAKNRKSFLSHVPQSITRLFLSDTRLSLSDFEEQHPSMFSTFYSLVTSCCQNSL